MIEEPGGALEQRLQATAEALARQEQVIYEASFSADQVFVSVDILEREERGFRVVEVKSSTRVKEEHIPDVAVQAHVLGRCGLDIRGVEIMHLNPDCRYPNLDDLFVRTDVTEAVTDFLPRVPGEIEAQLRILDGPFPEAGFGEHCLTAKACPFQDRCWPQQTPDHVLTLYRLGAARKWQLIERGIESIHDLESARALGKVAQRQVRAVKAGGRVVSRRLAKALAPFEGRLAFLDFETVNLAIPVWDGCGPWAQMPVQFSCHKERKPGWPEHFEFLADGAEDCRQRMAQALLEACGGADRVVAYNASFEKACIRRLAEGAPSMAEELESLAERLIDLLPLVRDYVYDPAFLGSFRLKSVLPVLLPDLDYEDLEIRDGQNASLNLGRLLFRPEMIAESERSTLRASLLEYCKRDTWATLRLLEKLRELGTAARP